jgi:uncharacterized membrane protein YuzA (DUF378 family)
MDKLDYIDWASLILVFVGAVNWGLVGLGRLTNAGAETYNLIYLIFNSLGGAPQAESLLYLLVGLAGLYQVYFGYQLYES